MIDGFKSAKDVTQSSDKDNGTIIGKGTMRLATPAIDYVQFTFSIIVRDGKYKYSFKDFYHEGSTSGGVRNGGNLDNEKPACGGFRMTGGYWQKIKDKTADNVNSMIASLERKMREQSFSEDFK